MADLVSVIIPIYNVEAYLAECIESILTQTYTRLEILLIDDGSSDHSAQIAQSYMKQDKRIQLIKQGNKGQSAARNKGLNQANGKYVLFVDSDDWVAPHHIEELYLALINSHSKVSMSCFTKDLNKISKELSTDYQIIKGSFIKLADKLYHSEFPAMSPCCKLYERSLFDTVRFHEGIIYEDGILFYEIIDQIEQMTVLKSNSYYYRTAENSTLTSKVSRKNFDVFKKNAILKQFFEEKHPEQLGHFYQRSINLNDMIAVKSYQDDRREPLNKELIEALRKQNIQYSKHLFPRKLMYISKFGYFFCLMILSKLFKTNKAGKENYLKRIIRKVVK